MYCHRPMIVGIRHHPQVNLARPARPWRWEGFAVQLEVGAIASAQWRRSFGLWLHPRSRCLGRSGGGGRGERVGLPYPVYPGPFRPANQQHHTWQTINGGTVSIALDLAPRAFFVQTLCGQTCHDHQHGIPHIPCTVST